MHENTYLPKGLPFIPDRMLRLAAVEYRKLCDEAKTPVDATDRTELADALRAIEDELHARGIGGTPWWSGTDLRHEA